MEKHPIALQRPLVVIGGFIDPGIAAAILKSRFKSATGDGNVVGVSLGECMSFDECQQKIVSTINRKFPSKSPAETIEVDVVGVSMGGVVARYAALPAGETKHRRLNIVRLYTISSPHMGSEMARNWPLLHPLQKELRPGSPTLARINKVSETYVIIPYVRLGDHVVGAPFASPPGFVPWWLPNQPASDPHGGACFDPRILADIARRLRAEAPTTIGPTKPLPRHL